MTVILDQTGEGYHAVNPQGDVVSVRIKTLKPGWRVATEEDLQKLWTKEFAATAFNGDPPELATAPVAPSEPAVEPAVDHAAQSES